MGLNAEAAKKSAEDLKVARAQMEKDNLAQMEALAKEHPEPTIETLQRAMGVPVRKQPEPEVTPEVAKTSEPKADTDKGAYVTRTSTPTNKAPPAPQLAVVEKDAVKK